MARWLLKTEPETYSWEQLSKDKTTCWDGIGNALALKHMRTMQKGELALIYHTGDERRAMGVAEIIKGPYADPKQDDARLVVVDLKVKKKFKRAVSLEEMKADPTFEGWDLLRIGRLSVVPVNDAMWARIEELASSEAD